MKGHALTFSGRKTKLFFSLFFQTYLGPLPSGLQGEKESEGEGKGKVERVKGKRKSGKTDGHRT